MKKSRSLSFLGLLGAVAITLSFLEGLLPPLPFLPPGAKAGFSNIVTMFTASYFGLAPTLCLCLIKSLFVLITRGISAFCMSLLGGLFSAVVMWICFWLRTSLLLTGVLGAIAHNTAQLLTAMVLTGTPYLFTYYPFLLLFALVAGSITGLILQAVYRPLCRVGQRLPLSKKGEKLCKKPKF